MSQSESLLRSSIESSINGLMVYSMNAPIGFGSIIIGVNVIFLNSDILLVIFLPSLTTETGEHDPCHDFKVFVTGLIPLSNNCSNKWELICVKLPNFWNDQKTP